MFILKFFFQSKLNIRLARKHKGYTLIEILVVISIVGFMAAAAMYLVNSSREKGRIAGLLQFSSGIKASLANYPVSFWSFDNGSATDGFGNNHGTLNGGMTCSSAGVIGKACYFDGSNDWITKTSPSGLPLGNNPFTISAWVNFDSTPNFKIITAWGSMGSRGVNWFTISGGKLMHINFNNSGDLAANTALSANKWHHVVVTYDGAKRRFYADGKLDGENTPQTMAVTGGDFTIAYDANGNGHHYKGYIDEVQVYSGAISFSQIKKMYAEGAAKRGIAIYN